MSARHTGESYVGLLLAFGAAVLFAATTIFAKLGVRTSDRNTGVLISLLVNVTAMTVLAGIFGVAGRLAPVTATGVALFATAGLFTAFLARTLLYAGIHHIGASRANAIAQASPVVAVTLGVVVLKEPISPAGAIGIALGLCGVALFVRECWQRAPEPAAPSHGLRSVSGPSRTGLFFSVGAAASYGVGHALRKQGISEMPDPLVGAAIGVWMAAIVSAALLRLRRDPTSTDQLARGWTNRFFWFAGASSTFAQLLFFTALLHAPVAYVTVVVASQSVMTIVLGAWLFPGSEAFTGRLWAAAAAVLLGAGVIALG